MAKKIEPVKNVPEGTNFSELEPKTDSGITTAWMGATDKRIGDIEQLTKYILGIAILTILAIVVAVIGIVVDQMRFNNQSYKQQSSDSQTQIRLLQEEVNSLKAKR